MDATSSAFPATEPRSRHSMWRRVDPSRLRSLAVAAALVGLLAGIVAATFASIAGEPAIDEAIAIEEANAAARPGDPAARNEDDASVSRSDQRGVGLFGAYALTGAAFGALLALTAHGLRRGRPDPARRVVLAGVILAGAFTVAPWLKYPPNPPAVGDPGTLAERQTLYVTVMCIAAALGLGATILSRRLRAAGWAEHRRLAVVVAAVAMPMLAAYALLPPAPDEVSVPATLVWRFRVASLGANLSLWATLTLALAWLAAEAQRMRSPAEPAASVPLTSAT
jgi:predicted cobalt transporter CbtA